MSENSSDLGAFLAGFVIGGLVGAATAIILAPQSGEETRQKLANKSQELRSASGDRVQSIRDSAGTYTQEYRDRAGSLLESTRDRVQDAGGRIQEQARIVLDSGKKLTGQGNVDNSPADVNGSVADADAPATD